MFICKPGKYYLVSVLDDKDECIVSRINIESIESRMKDVYAFQDGFNTTTYVTGELFGRLKILEPKDMETISYEELMDIIKE